MEKTFDFLRTENGDVRVHDGQSVSSKKAEPILRVIIEILGDRNPLSNRNSVNAFDIDDSETVYDEEELCAGIFEEDEYCVDDEEEYDLCSSVMPESDTFGIHSISFESAAAEFGVPQIDETLAEAETDNVYSECNEGERYRLLGEEEEEEAFDAAQQERLYFEDIRYRFLAVEEDCAYVDHIDLDDYDLDEETFDELCMGII